MYNYYVAGLHDLCVPAVSFTHNHCELYLILYHIILGYLNEE